MGTRPASVRDHKALQARALDPKPLIVGQAPNSDGTNDAPLTGYSGKRLAELMLIPFDAYQRLFERVNLLDYYPGSSGKGDKFPVGAAREAATAMSFERRPLVILLGRGVAKAFGLGRLPNLCAFQIETPFRVGGNVSYQTVWNSVNQPAPTIAPSHTWRYDKQHGPGWLEVRKTWVALVPHTSGVNRWYNDEANFCAASKLLMRMIHVAGVLDA